ncbi:hypothetical protein [Agrobacterium leguminum]|jgi:hypothetical protein
MKRLLFRKHVSGKAFPAKVRSVLRPEMRKNKELEQWKPVFTEITLALENRNGAPCRRFCLPGRSVRIIRGRQSK